MRNIGYFDADGKCLMIHAGDGEPPADLEYATAADVPPELGPNTCKLVDGVVVEKERDA